MFELNLINEVRENDILWNKDNIRYTNKVYRDETWQKIAHNLGESEEACRKRWRSLRDRFIREMVTERKAQTGRIEEPPKKKWEYFRDLQFLQEMVASKKNASSKRKKLEYSTCSMDSTSGETTEPDSFTFVDANVSAVDDLLNSINNPKASGSSNPPAKKVKHDQQPPKNFRTDAELCDDSDLKAMQRCESPFDTILGVIGDFFDKIPDEEKIHFKMDILNYTYKKFEQLNNDF